jgi:hypothetical protein
MSAINAVMQTKQRRNSAETKRRTPPTIRDFVVRLYIASSADAPRRDVGRGPHG